MAARPHLRRTLGDDGVRAVAAAVTAWGAAMCAAAAGDPEAPPRAVACAAAAGIADPADSGASLARHASRWLPFPTGADEADTADEAAVAVLAEALAVAVAEGMLAACGAAACRVCGPLSEAGDAMTAAAAASEPL